MRDRSVVRRDERGATLIVVAAFAIVAMIMMAFVIDIGGLRAEKKEVTLSTDAAALAAASVIDFSDPQAVGGNVRCRDVDSTDSTYGPTVEHVALHYLTENGDSILGDCRIFFGSKSDAYVTVTASDDVAYTFGQVIGANGGTAFGSSSARVASPAGGNLYPVGMCSSAADLVLDGQDSKIFDPPISENPQFENAACGGAGNKRQVQFDPTRTGNSCGAPAGMWCYDFNNGGFDGAPLQVESDPGKDWQKAKSTIEAFMLNGTHFWVPAIKYLYTNGTKATYEVTHFIEVTITSYSKQSGMGLLIHQIAKYHSSGPPATSIAPKVDAHICAVGPDTTACTNNPPPSTGSPGGGPPSGANCVVSSSTPKNQDVPSTSGGTSTAGADITVVVANAANCESTLGIAAIDGTRSIFGQQVSKSGNTYQMRFPSGTAFGAIKTFPIQVYSGGIIDETMQLRTVVGTPPCNPTSIAVSPPGPYGRSGGGNENIDTTVVFTVKVTATAHCSGFTAILRNNGNPAKTNELAESAVDGNTFTATATIGTGSYKPNNGQGITSKWDLVLSTASGPLAYSPITQITVD